MLANLPQRQIGNTGLAIDTLGFGCAPLGNLYQPITDETAHHTLRSAWQAGFRYFDTAPHYGQGLSERRVGDLLRPMRGHDYVISTKVGRLLSPAGYANRRHGFCSPMPFDFHYDYSYDGIMRSFEDSLQRLGLDRVDILYMHDIGRLTHGDNHEHLFNIAMKEGYKALAQLRSSGVVKAIGLGVNEAEVCEQALEIADWDCFLLAGRYTLLEQAPSHSLLAKCQQNHCSIIIGGPFNSGILATGTKKSSPVYYDYGIAPAPIVNKVKQLERLCLDFGIPLAAAALQFPLAHPSVASVIPGMASSARIEQTLSLLQTTIDKDFWQQLKIQGLIHPESPTPV